MNCGIDGATHDFNAIPYGINGAVRQASELWIGVNGATKKVWPTFPVHVDYDRGLDGHSDADVLVHAIMDALLGAAAVVALLDVGKVVLVMFREVPGVEAAMFPHLL